MSTLQKVLLADKEDKITGRNATIGMVWLKRYVVLRCGLQTR